MGVTGVGEAGGATTTGATTGATTGTAAMVRLPVTKLRCASLARISW